MSTRENFLDHLADLTARTSDRGILQDARRIQRRLEAVPMADILECVPGLSIKDKIRKIGVSRTAYYSWLHGICRPRDRAARKLAKLTGLSVDAIRGRDDPA